MTLHNQPKPAASGRYASLRWLVLPLAFLIDLTLGDPDNRRHPVAWMGTMITFLQRQAPPQGRLAQFVSGSLLALGGASAWAGVAWLLLTVSRLFPTPLRILIEALLLKMTFSFSGLIDAGRQIEVPLRSGDLARARQQLGWHLVSRDTTQLDESQVAAATIESLAENTSDSVIAPLCFYALGGLPAAYAYRFLNTADAMLGYRDAGREWLGKAAARLDDLANFLPARFTTLLMIGCAGAVDGSTHRAWRIWRRDAGNTSSPNAGHPMAAAAGVLNVELDKVGHYRLGVGQTPARRQDIDRAIHLVRIVVMVAVVAITLVQRRIGAD